MFENIAANKYLIIALIIALIVVLFLYSQKKSCQVEPMKTLELAPVDFSTDIEDKSKGKSKSKSRGKSKSKSKRKSKRKLKYAPNKYLGFDNGIPKPLDDRPDLSQCQPCICPGDSSTEETDATNETNATNTTDTTDTADF